MRLCVLFCQVMAVIRRNEPYMEVPAKLYKLFVDGVLFRKFICLDLKVEIVSAEDPLIIEGGLAGLFYHPCSQIVRDLTLQTGGKSYQSAAVLFKEILVDPGLIIETVDISLAHKAGKVLVSVDVFAEEYQVKAFFVCTRALFFMVVGYVYFTAYYRLQTGLIDLFVELYSAKKIPVVGHRDCRYIKLLGLCYQVVYPDSSVKQTVFCMEMKRDILGRH
ncbi:hypothetical protein BMS3Abin09_00184 [bacterium BMS3Abin09]|nr:hypothetical protein BMS3Abin09_00184 [bacterium BMS3Abin09]